MKTKSMNRLLDWVCLVYTSRWALWLAAFLPPVRQVWQALVAIPDTGSPLQHLALQIGENPLWTLLYYKLLGLPGSCVLLALLFLRCALPFILPVLHCLLRCWQWAANFRAVLISQPPPRTYKRYYLRWIDQEHGEALYDLQNGKPSDTDGHLIRTVIPGGELLFDPHDKSVVLNAGGLRWAKLSPQESMVLPLENGTRPVLLIYAAIEANLPH